MTRWLHITSGRGPEECQWVVAQVVPCVVKDAEEAGIKVFTLDLTPGHRAGTFKSVLLSLDGDCADEFITRWVGTIQWIGTSPFRPNHKRRNWYVGIEAISPREQQNWSERDIHMETMRSSGPGGQHVNKAETAVRVTHLPTGISAIAREERSQYLNRKLALARLHARLEGYAARSLEEEQQDQWNVHNRLERGNPVKVFHGKDFMLKQGRDD